LSARIHRRLLRFVEDRSPEFGALALPVNGLDRLLQTDGDQQADADGPTWMKKSFQVWVGLWGGCTSSIKSPVSGCPAIIPHFG